VNRAARVPEPRFQHGLGFDPQDAVRWLAPRELARAAVKAVLSAVFADYADKREIQASFPQGVLLVPGAPPDSPEDCWFDYVADLGDGFDATYTIASLLAEESLTPQHQDTALPRGALLVLGGDEVYPTASAQAYEDRMTGPYRAALPHADDPPLMLALPGNHDWYDGLTSFLRTFTHGRAIGGWRTQQARSYFAVRLPHHWWLVGLDSQFESYIDEPQLKYFDDNLSRQLQPGDGVILCSASPTWLKTEKDPDAFNPLFWFEKHYIRSKPAADGPGRVPTGAEVRLWLTGDLHHYARYVEDLDMPDPPEGVARQMVTCGLGGAFLSATHHLRPGFRVLPEMSRSYRSGDRFTSFLRATTLYPDEATSRALSKDLAKPWKSDRFLLWRNPGLLPLLAGAHTVLFLVLFLVFGQGSIDATSQHGRVVASFLEASPSEVVWFAVNVLVTISVIAGLALIAPKIRGLDRPLAVPPGMVAAALAQVVVLLAVFVALGFVVGSDRIGAVAMRDWPDIAVIVLVSGLNALLSGLIGGLVLGISLVCFRKGAPLTWQMSGQAIEDYKGFLRIRLSDDGLLTVFPLVVDRINRDWVLRPFDTPTDPTTGQVGPPVQVPRATDRLPTPRLLETPFSIVRTAATRMP
jgi:hypothetical protein